MISSNQSKKIINKPGATEIKQPIFFDKHLNEALAYSALCKQKEECVNEDLLQKTQELSFQSMSGRDSCQTDDGNSVNFHNEENSNKVHNIVGDDEREKKKQIIHGKIENKKAGTFSKCDFSFGATLGTGSFGRVKFCTLKSDQTCWAIKMLKKMEILKMQQIEHVMNEKNILAEMDHPFVVRMAGTFQDSVYLYVIMEYVIGGEFFTHLRRAHRFNDHTAMFYAAHVILIFEYLHGKDIIYRDLKPENLLLDSEGFLKITDFGFAKVVPFKTYTLCGTPEYIAPEVLLNKGHGRGVDWWTLGILIYEMTVGQPPFVDEDPLQVYQQVLSAKISFPRCVEKNTKSLIKKLLTSDLTKRYGCLKGGAKDVKSHRWVAQFDFDMLLSRKMVPPIKPHTNGSNDTSQFDQYPESEELDFDCNDDITFEKDPFMHF